MADWQVACKEAISVLPDLAWDLMLDNGHLDLTLDLRDENGRVCLTAIVFTHTVKSVGGQS